MPEQLQTIIEHLSQAVVYLEADGRISFINPAAQKLFGLGPQEALALNYAMRQWGVLRSDGSPCPPDEHPPLVALRTGQPQKQGILGLTSNDGGIVWLSVDALPVLLPGQERPAGVVATFTDITSFHVAEDALRQSEETCRLFFDHSPLGVMHFDLQGVIVACNDRFAEIIGAPKERLLGLNMLSTMKDGPARQALQDSLSTGTGLFEGEYTSVTGGRRMFLRAHHRLLRNDEAQAQGVVSLFEDITEVKRADAARRESEERLRLLFENSLDAVFLTMPDGAILDANPAACRMLGYSLEELRAGGRNMVVDQTDPRLKPALELRAAKGFVQAELTMIRSDGVKVPVELFSSSYTDSDGRLLASMIVRDLTQRKLTEDALRQSEARFRQLYDNTPIAYQSLDSDGLILAVNMAWLNALGYKEEEVLGRWFGSFLLPDFIPHFEANFPCFKQAGQISGVEFQMVKKDGTLILVSFNGSIATDAAGKMLRTHCVFLDITEQRRLEAQLRQSQKMEAVGTLAGGIAHDFNNILAAIMGFAEMAAEDARKGKVDPTDLEQILISSQRAKELVRRILAFSRKSEPDQAPLSLNQVIGRAVAMLERTLPKMIAIETDLAQSLPPVWADSAQVEQVLLNLAGNAADAMPEGGRLVIETQAVELDAEYCRGHLAVRPGRYARLTVSDSGQGMDAATMERMFEPFFTTKGVGQGTGLGLSTVFGIVKGHGGHIQCYSHPGDGASFTIYLPLPEESLPPAVGAPQPPPQESPGGSEAILVVDDEETLRALAARTLGDRGYSVLIAASGEEALALYRERGSNLALVIMDLGMPGMGGHKAMEAILALNPQARIIIASGYSARHQVQAALDAGAAGYVAKPFRRADLLATVRQALDRR